MLGTGSNLGPAGACQSASTLQGFAGQSGQATGMLQAPDSAVRACWAPAEAWLLQAPAGLHKWVMPAKPLTGSWCAAGLLKLQSGPAGLSPMAAGMLQELCRMGVPQVVRYMRQGHAGSLSAAAEMLQATSCMRLAGGLQVHGDKH